MPKEIGISDNSVLEVTAGPTKSGTWSAYKGYEISEKMQAFLPRIYGLDLSWSSSILVSSILFKATKLVHSQECERKSYWEEDLHQDKNYTKP